MLIAQGSLKGPPAAQNLLAQDMHPQKRMLIARRPLKGPPEAQNPSHFSL